jgi:hypothetical protein
MYRKDLCTHTIPNWQTNSFCTVKLDIHAAHNCTPLKRNVLDILSKSFSCHYVAEFNRFFDKMSIELIPFRMTQFHAGFSLDLNLNFEDGGDIFRRKVENLYRRLHNQKTLLFIIIVV